jgi:hypothetical protein
MREGRQRCCLVRDARAAGFFGPLPGLEQLTAVKRRRLRGSGRSVRSARWRRRRGSQRISDCRQSEGLSRALRWRRNSEPQHALRGLVRLLAQLGGGVAGASELAESRPQAAPTGWDGPHKLYHLPYRTPVPSLRQRGRDADSLTSWYARIRNGQSASPFLRRFSLARLDLPLRNHRVHVLLKQHDDVAGAPSRA